MVALSSLSVLVYLFSTAWLQPALAARHAAGTRTALKLTSEKCPESAASDEPDSDGDCNCDTSGYSGKSMSCFEKMPTGEWKKGCLSATNIDDPDAYRSDSYFHHSCSGCQCLPHPPEIDSAGGSYVVVKHADNVKIMRQGQTVHEVTATDRVNYSFSGNLHKEYLVIAKTEDTPGGLVEKPVFAKSSDLCGVGIFTTDHLVCSKLGAEGGKGVATAVDDKLKATAASEVIDRGFGIEFELVARKIPEELKERIKSQQNSGFRFWVGRQFFNGITGLAQFIAQRNNQSDIADAIAKYGDLETLLEKFGSYNLPALEECFVNTTKSPDLINQPCSKTSDCALTQYCMDCDACAKAKSETMGGKIWDTATSWIPGRWKNKLPDVLVCKGCEGDVTNVCKPRSECEKNLAAGAAECPIPLKKWDWTFDPSVEPLQKEEAKALKVGNHEDEGAGFELVSPPIAGLEGTRSTMEVLTVLKRMGVQAGVSTGMHVHVNVASEKVPGTKLTTRQIANLWVAFAKFQLVIDEMMSPSRLGNHYARRLFLGECPASEYSSEDSCSDENPCHCAKRFFKQIHAYVNSAHDENVKDFCNAALSIPSDPNPCDQRYPDQRYYALNLVPLTRIGTVEFRAHSSTYDEERVLRWVQFVVAFVEHFGAGAPDDASPFLDGSAEDGLKALAQAQRMATAEELFASLEGKLNPGTKAFYEARVWEQDAPGCNVQGPPALSDAEKLQEFRNSSKILRALGEQMSVSKIPGPDGDE